MKWKVDEAEDLPLAVIEDNEDGNGICTLDTINHANARLIAAAPELLNMLKRIKKLVPYENPPRRNQRGEIEELIKRIEA